MKTKCLIYVSSKWLTPEVNEFVSKFKSNTFLKTFEIEENDFFDAMHEHEFPDGFLFFKSIVAIHFEQDIEMDSIVDFVNKLLQYLWSENIPAVASCNYEDLLINSGGYKSNTIPW